MRCELQNPVTSRVALGACLVLAWHTAGAAVAPGAGRADSLLRAVEIDSARTLPPIVVHGRRPARAEILERLPGHTSVVELAPLRDRLTTTAQVLEQVPGLHVDNYGSLGAFSTVSIRGSSASQVSVYLDGMPLVRAGLGVVNLADLPFAALERVEVYRGFAPPELPGASLGGAINLVTRGAAPGGPPMHGAAVVAGSGSFGTHRLGLSQEFVQGGWSGLLVADHLESAGDFDFLDDNGTPLNPADDEVVPRRNNWFRGDEVLARLALALPRQGELRLFNQWVRREQGVAGISSYQSQNARAGTAYVVTSAETRFPALGRGRLGAQARLFHEWRRDTFADPRSEIGLGYQDNRDASRTWGTQVLLQARPPRAPELTLDLAARRERFLPRRRYPRPQEGPEQERTALEAGIETRLQFAARLHLHAGMRAARRDDRFSGDLRTPYSQRPAYSGRSTELEPRLGLRLRIWRGLQARASYGEYERAPGFLELFGDGGSLAGSSDLVAETGIDRDVGLQLAAGAAGMEMRLGVAHFHNSAQHLIALLPQSQRTFVARNIGSARLRGEEWFWHLSDARHRRWSLDGNCTRLEATDLGVDIRWYAGKSLPGRPALQIGQRLGVELGPVELGYEYDHLGRNYLDRWNREVVAQRDLHGLDARAAWRGWSVQLGLRNLTDERAADVAGFPLPGRSFVATTSFKH